MKTENFMLGKKLILLKDMFFLNILKFNKVMNYESLI